jgi:hypothetical protein
MLGFRYQELLHGGFYFLASPVDERSADLTLDIEVRDLPAFALSRTATVHGRVKLAGFADDPDGTGKLVFDKDEKRALYEVSFRADDGVAYRLRGYKQLEVLNLVDSFTLVRGSLYDMDAREVGRVVVRFDVRGNWASLVRSFQPTW